MSDKYTGRNNLDVVMELTELHLRMYPNDKDRNLDQIFAKYYALVEHCKIQDLSAFLSDDFLKAWRGE